MRINQKPRSVMKRDVFRYLTTFLVLLFALSSCLGTMDFLEDLGDPTFNVNVDGSLDIFNANNAILWVANRTMSVNIDTIAVLTDEPRPSEIPPELWYPREWAGPNGGPVVEAGKSHASYHRPAVGRTAELPILYIVRITGIDPRNNNTPFVLEIPKVMPSPRDYAIFLVRTREGELRLVDQEKDIMPDIDPDDSSNPPGPPAGGVTRHPLIVRNRTRSAFITNVITDSITHSNQIDQANQYPYALDARIWPTTIRYTIQSNNANGETPSFNAVVVETDKHDSQSWHLLFLDFYKSRDGSYRVTQNWPPNDLDPEDQIHGNFDAAKVRILNRVSSATVYAVSARQESPRLPAGQEYPVSIITSDYFTPPGVISRGIDWDRDAKVAAFEDNPLDAPEFKINTGRPYTIDVFIRDTRYNVGRDIVIARFEGKNLFMGVTIDIEITEKDVDWGIDNQTRQPPQPIVWSAHTNGGPPADDISDDYTSNRIFVNFGRDPGALTLSNFNISSTNVVLNNLVRNSETSYEIGITVHTAGQVTLTCNAPDLDENDKIINVYRQNQPPPPPPPPEFRRVILYNQFSETAVLLGMGQAALFNQSFTEPQTWNIPRTRTGDVITFSGVFLRGEQPRTSDLNSSNQGSANWRIFEIVGGGGSVEFVRIVSANNRAVTETLGITHAGDGTQVDATGMAISNKNVAIRIASGFTGEFTIRVTIPTERGGGDPPLTKSYRVVVE